MSRFFLLVSVFFGFSLPAFLQASVPSARAWMGVGIEKGKKGVLITKVMAATPAYKAGFKAGDEILSVDKVVVLSPKQLIEVIAGKGIGVSVTVAYLRGGKKAEKSFTLEAKPDMDRLQKTQLLGKKAPGFDLPVLFGDKGALGAYKGQVVLLTFWATWCPACKASLGRLEEIARQNKGKIHVVTLVSEKPKVLKSFFANKKPAFSVLHDKDGVISSKYYVAALPSFVVVDKEGVVRRAVIGGGSYLESALEASLEFSGK